MSTDTEVAPRRVAFPEPAVPAEPPVTILRPPCGWQLLNLRELWQFRDLLYFLVWRDVKVRYKQTLLGAAWAVLQPALLMIVFTLFFSNLVHVDSAGLPYPVFVYAGVLPWTFFATALANAGNSVIGSERLITKVYFPRLAIPFAAVGAAVVDFAIALGLLVVLMLAYGITPGVGIVLAPLVFALVVLAALGVGTLLAALNVSYRDFRYVIPFLVQVWMFATPTVYMHPHPVEGDAEWWPLLLALNPMVGLVGTFRAVMLGLAIPWAQLGISAAVAAAAFPVGCFYFRLAEDHFADVI
jgi:lipopolysaccharide transport system permease protein